MQITGFEMQELIGEGGMAFVWKARQESLDRTVAVKMLKPHIARNPEDITSFLREARAAAALKHPGIVQVYDIAERDGAYYLVMEYINGPTVGRLINRAGPMATKRALAIAGSVAEALNYAWDRAQLIHRDIKPHNILIDADGTVKLSDLGLALTVARSARAATGNSDCVDGTPNYISPEQARGASHIDFRSDMYSLGASLYHMVTGRIPFGELSPMDAAREQCCGHLPHPRDLVPDLPTGVGQLITRLMMRDPGARFGTWAEATEAIRRVAAGRRLMSGQQSAGDSTVSPVSAPAGGEQAAQAARRRSMALGPPERVPSWFRTLAWAAMLTLWGAMLWQRTRLPPLIPIPEKTFRQPGAGPAAAGSKETASTPTDQDPAARPGGEAAPPGTSQAVSAPGTTPSPNVGYDAATRERLELVIRYLLAENFAQAEQLLTASIASAGTGARADSLRILRDFVTEIARMPQLIENEFMRHTGTEVRISHNNQTHLVLLKAVTSGKVFGEIRTNQETLPVQFEIAQLSPAERSRWLGVSTAPSVNAMRCILLLKGGDIARARQQAPNCGPLSFLLQQQIAARTR